MTGERSLHGEPARFAGGLHAVGDRTWAWLQPNGDWGESNAGVVAGDGATLLVDTLWDLRLTRRMLDAVRATADAPVTTVLHTHADGDHVFGDAALPTGTAIVACRAAARELAHENPRELQRLKRLAGVGRRAPGSLGGLARYATAMLGPFDFRGVRIVGPTRTFTAEMELEVGGRCVRARRVGPAHTAADTIVIVDDADVVFAGDVLFAGVTPNAWSGPIAGWRAALDQLGNLRASTIVPGHGPVGGDEAVAALDAYWAWVQDEGGRLLAAGRSPLAAAQELLAGIGEHPWGTWDSPERLLCNLTVLERERRGAPPGITHAERPAVVRAMGSLVTG